MGITLSGSICTFSYKKKQHVIICYTLLKNWCSLWSPKIMKDEFDAVVVSATKSCQTLLLLAAIFILVRAWGDNYKILVLPWNTKTMKKSDPYAECVLLWHTHLSIK